MKVLIIGYGSIGRRHADAFRCLGLGVEIYDPFCAEATLPNLTNIPTDIDGIVVANPSELHLSTLVKIESLQLPILIEKPLSVYRLTNSEKDWLLSEKLSRTYFASNMWFHHGVIKAKSILSDGVLGKIGSVNLFFQHAVTQQGKNRKYSIDSKQGGVWLDVAPHEFMVVNRLFPGDYSGTALQQSCDDFSFEDSYVSVVLKNQHSGMLITMNLDLVSKVRRRGMTIIGDRGTFKWEEMGKPTQYTDHLCLAPNNYEVNKHQENDMFKLQAENFVLAMENKPCELTPLKTAVKLTDQIHQLKSKGRL